MAKPEHLKVVKEGREAIDRWRQEHPGEQLDLRKADLTGANLFLADLTGADLIGADLFLANLTMAHLSGANLIEADLTMAHLSGADLSGAHLSGADLSGANLTGADLTGANLTMAKLSFANFSEANLTGAKCSHTLFAWVDLSRVKGLESVKHEGPSSIGIDTIIASFRGAGNRRTPGLEAFFLGAGVPKELLAALPGILAKVPYCTCFICYGEPDRAFAERLTNDLKARGVSCWLYPLDATPGERTWQEIGQKRSEAEKMVALCSAQALVRDGVLKEIEEQIDDDPDKMVPISLDDLWKEPGFRVMRGTRDLKPFLLERNYADFSDPSSYEKSLERLLKGLERGRRPTHGQGG